MNSHAYPGRSGRNRSFFSILNAVILLAGAATMLLPFVWMILASLKTNGEFLNTFKWFPETPHWDNYRKLLFPDKGHPFLLYFYNTVKVTGLAMIGTVLSCSLVAFAFARIPFPGKGFIFGFAVISMFLPSQVTMIPQFIIFRNLGWIGSHYPLIVPPFLATAFGIILLRQFFRSIPKEMDEAAKIDGAGWFKIYSRIHLPLMISPMLTLGILTLQEKWGEILYPMIFIGKDSSLWTMVLRIRDISTGQYNQSPELEMAGNVLLVLPIIVLFIVAQPYFVKSISTSGVKG